MQARWLALELEALDPVTTALHIAAVGAPSGIRAQHAHAHASHHGGDGSCALPTAKCLSAAATFQQSLALRMPASQAAKVGEAADQQLTTSTTRRTEGQERASRAAVSTRLERIRSTPASQADKIGATADHQLATSTRRTDEQECASRAAVSSRLERIRSAREPRQTWYDTAATDRLQP